MCLMIKATFKAFGQIWITCNMPINLELFVLIETYQSNIYSFIQSEFHPLTHMSWKVLMLKVLQSEVTHNSDTMLEFEFQKILKEEENCLNLLRVH